MSQAAIPFLSVSRFDIICAFFLCVEIPPCFQKRLAESERQYREEERAIREEVAALAREDFEGEVLIKMEEGVPRSDAEAHARQELQGWMDEWSELERQRIQEVLYERMVRNYFVYRAVR